MVLTFASPVFFFFFLFEVNVDLNSELSDEKTMNLLLSHFQKGLCKSSYNTKFWNNPIGKLMKISYRDNFGTIFTYKFSIFEKDNSIV